jgi:hypothetical protein
MKSACENVLMRWACWFGLAAAVSTGAVLLSAPSCHGQAPAPVNNGSQLPRRIPPPRQVEDPVDGAGSSFYEKRLRMLNSAQHDSMVADTDRLVKMVAELNAQVSRSNAKSLTPEQLRMVAEIEKLAHSVRDKMRMSVRSSVYGDMAPPAPFAPR